LPGPSSGFTDIVKLEDQFLTGETQISVQLPAPTAVEEPRPTRLASLRVQPNPFNPRTSIRFRLSAASTVDLRVYDAAGTQVRMLAVGRFGAGEQAVGWDGCDDRGHRVASGAYFCRLNLPNSTAVAKLIVLE
jgi:hypothetical protein